MKSPDVYYIRLQIKASLSTFKLCSPLYYLCSKASTPHVVMRWQLNAKPYILRNPSAETHPTS